MKETGMTEAEEAVLARAKDFAGVLDVFITGNMPIISRLTTAWYARWAEAPGTAEKIVDLARCGDDIAHKVLITTALIWTVSERPFHLPLQRYVVETALQARRQKPRGRKSTANEDRNFAIAMLVWAIVQREGLPPTRNEASEGESACSITAKVLAGMGLQLEVRGVEKIWRNRHEMWRGGREEAAPFMDAVFETLDDLKETRKDIGENEFEEIVETLIGLRNELAKKVVRRKSAK